MTPKPIHVLVAGHEPAFLRQAETALGADKSVVRMAAVEGLIFASEPLRGTPPDVAVVHEGHEPAHRLDGIDQFTRRFPGVPVILVCATKDPDRMVQALRAGVKEFLFEPVSATELLATVKRLAALGEARGDSPGKVMAFVSCKGGSGATFLATNLAHVLAAEKHKNVLLLDLNLQFGDAYLFVMDQMPAVTLSDVCMAIGRLDASFLESATANLPSGLHVLAAPATPEDGDAVKPEHVEAILRLARTCYDFVVVDVGRSFDPTTLTALDLADEIYAVLQLDLPYVRHAKRMQKLFQSLGYGKNKVRWVINRYVGKEDIALGDATRLLTEAYWTIPNDHKSVVTSVNQGIPVTTVNRHSPVAASLTEWAARLVPEEPKQRSWLGLFRRSAPTAGT